MGTTETIVRVEPSELVEITDRKSIKDVIDLYVRLIPNVKDSSRYQYRKDLGIFFDWVDSTNRDYSSLNQLDIIAFSKHVESRGLSPLTVSSYLISIRRFFEWTDANGLYRNIAKGVKSPQRLKKFQKKALKDEQSKELLGFYDGKNLRDFAIVNLILRTGLRTIEVTRANVSDIDYIGGRRVLKVWGKGKLVGDKNTDFVILSDKAYKPIEEYLNTRGRINKNEPLFVTNRGRKRTKIEGIGTENYKGEKDYERLTTRTVSKICKTALTGIGLTGSSYTAHSLRHTTGCSIIRHNGTLEDVRYVLRHTSVKTSEIYLESIKEERRLESAPELILDNAF